MIYKEIMDKVIEKAIKNGFNFNEIPSNAYGGTLSDNEYYAYNGLYYSISDIIFSHKFAKAFFGEEPTCSACGWQKGQNNYGCIWCDNGADSTAWEYNLACLAKWSSNTKERIEYLKEFL